jgi:hypothetical protein
MGGWKQEHPTAHGFEYTTSVPDFPEIFSARARPEYVSGSIMAAYVDIEAA